ncbi:MAG TPA: mechanosensitive ion channel domain-containing protein [Polyangiaceae bacterium]|nr:mechanosensitive ion channel domain-containing protein [Polyangiaceae bacterium]
MKPAEPSISEPFIRVELFKVGSTTVTPTTLAIALVIVLLSFLFSRVVRAGMRRFFQRSGLTLTGDAGAMERLVHYGIVLVGILVAMRTTGIRLDALFAAGAVFAVGFGFAMQNIAQNFVSGVILLFERTIKPGDVIEVGGQIVKVQQMSIRATIVRTLDEEDVIVPNSSLVQSNVKNFTLEDNLYRVRVTVGVSHSSDVPQVKALLETCARAMDYREKGFEPRVLLLGLGASALEFEASVWMRDPWNHRIAGSKLREAIWLAFKEQQISIALPQVDMHLQPPVAESLRLLSERKTTNAA